MSIVRFFLKAVAGLVVAFIARALVTTGMRALTRDAFGTWPTGTQPPASYMVTAVATALVAGAVAGIMAALVVRRARIRHGVAYGALLSAMMIVADSQSLFSNPHLYQWPLVLSPLVAVPLGSWLVVCFKPLPRPFGADALSGEGVACPPVSRRGSSA